MARPKRLTEDQRLLWKSYRDLFQGLSGALQEQLLRDTPLSGSEHAVLVELSHAPGGVLRARELGAGLGWDRSRLSHLVTEAGRGPQTAPRLLLAFLPTRQARRR